jgi:hypothetical protein
MQMAVLAICIAQHWLYRYVYGNYIEVVKFAVTAVRFHYFAEQSRNVENILIKAPHFVKVAVSLFPCSCTTARL